MSEGEEKRATKPRIKVSRIPPGNGGECPFGGVKIRVKRRTFRVCNGAPGPQGPPGLMGLMGTMGATGATGVSGAVGATGPAGTGGVVGFGEVSAMTQDRLANVAVTTFPTFTPWTGFAHNGVAVGTVPAAPTITIGSTGVWRVTYSISFINLNVGSAPQLVFAVSTTNLGVTTNIEPSSAPPLMAQMPTRSGSGLLSLTAGDVVGVSVSCFGMTPSLEVRAGNLNVQRIM